MPWSVRALWVRAYPTEMGHFCRRPQNPPSNHADLSTCRKVVQQSKHSRAPRRRRLSPSHLSNRTITSHTSHTNPTNPRGSVYQADYRVPPNNPPTRREVRFRRLFKTCQLKTATIPVPTDLLKVKISQIFQISQSLQRFTRSPKSPRLR